ncbi:MAG: hypothetical protein IT230_07060 [Flavobacteriales bacterium]|nr:hypothetical protein [Flavobacteriales bacterium]
MRRRFAILLLGLFAFTGTELHQLLKVPMLFAHYAEHQAEQPMGWMQFLEEHYPHDRHHHERGESHQGLPFQCDHHCGAQTLQAQLDGACGTVLMLPAPIDVQLIATEDRIAPREGPDGIWQPPRA